LGTVACSSPDPEQADPQKPNIVFLFADDYTFDALSALGSQVQTPNLDALMQSGTYFRNAYNMGGWHGAICVASRSMIISGTSLWEAQDRESRWRDEDSLAQAQTWGRLMQGAGYTTYMSGKWHVQVPANKVFDSVRHIRPGMPPDYWVGNDSTWRKLQQVSQKGGNVMEHMPLGYNRPQNKADTTWTSNDTEHGGFWSGGKHWSEVLKDDALDYLKDAQKNDNPFFMYLAFNAPHDPRQAPSEFLDLYPLDDIRLPASWLPQYMYADSIGNVPLLRDEALAPYPRTELAIRTHMREYFAIVSHLDHQIGLILETLEQTGLKDNTYVFFTGDHGLSVGRHGLLGKQNMYDHSMRVPLIMAGPGITPGKQVDADVYLQDIMATSLDLAEIPRPEYLYYHSLLKLAQGEQQLTSYPQGIYGAYANFQRMIRKDGFKLIVYPKVPAVRLYQLEEDPMEMNDLAQDEAYQAKIEELLSELISLQQELNDPLDISGIEFEN